MRSIRRSGVAAALVAMVFVAACGDGGTTSSEPTPTTAGSDTGTPTPAGTPTGATVQVVDNTYVPQTLTITAGTPVVWIQTGVGQHTVTADGDLFDSHPDCPANVESCMKQGETFVQTFDRPGRITYFCKLHKELGMTGEVVVV